MRQELEALRRRHASALELMGERDEQVEELRADLADVKEMYREQIDMLVRQVGLGGGWGAGGLGGWVDGDQRWAMVVGKYIMCASVCGLGIVQIEQLSNTMATAVGKEAT